ncbi:MAG: S-layer homology domain-containing protein, partial [Christensenellales bacterium]
ADFSGYKTSSFTDVKATDPAMPYIEWAVQKGIVSGTGNNQFSPNAAITREQIAVMMVNYAKVAGYTLPAARQYSAFADQTKISAWAETAVKAVQQAGVIVGKDGGKFDPQGSATRVEAATILRRYVELVIDEGTARGWVKNDSGHWQYYNWQGKCATGWLSVAGTDTKYYIDANGVMVTGKWLQIGGKWYYFNTDGKMARSATIEGYKVDGDGVRQEK